MSIIEVKNLKKSFGSNEVLKDINVSIAEKEVVCVIGPSGSGKSTFLRCLNRLEEITGGTVIIDDFDITNPKVDINKVREEVGMVFQHFNLFPHKTVLENVTLAPIKVHHCGHRRLSDWLSRRIDAVVTVKDFERNRDHLYRCHSWYTVHRSAFLHLLWTQLA